jgi:lipid II:glycine glycyltransferase (peptidoglycan interpeptide bridge formation enzyme)
MIQIITEKKDWDAELAQFKNLDFYHTYDYHYLSKKEDESPILIKYTEGKSVIVFPLLIRVIENTNYKDATSVYGYSGLLNLNIDDNFNKDNFHKELNAFFKESKIVSVFSRLHPFIEHEKKLLQGLGTIVTLGKVVYIDLTDTIENQRAKYNRRLKTYLNKSRKLCTIIIADTKEHIETFIDLYHDNMKRVDADDYYFFENAYFNQILSSEDFDAELKLCMHNETQRIIGGALFIKKGEIVQYHLSGLYEENFDVDPIKLMIDEMRIKATEEGFKYFNLGGGRGSSEDSLFRFKTSFSKDFKEFKLWKHIVDEEVYNMLVENHFKDHKDVDLQNVNFFPAYRAKIASTSH